MISDTITNFYNFESTRSTTIRRICWSKVYTMLVTRFVTWNLRFASFVKFESTQTRFFSNLEHFSECKLYDACVRSDTHILAYRIHVQTVYFTSCIRWSKHLTKQEKVVSFNFKNLQLPWILWIFISISKSLNKYFSLSLSLQ